MHSSLYHTCLLHNNIASFNVTWLLCIIYCNIIIVTTTLHWSLKHNYIVLLTETLFHCTIYCNTSLHCSYNTIFHSSLNHNYVSKSIEPFYLFNYYTALCSEPGLRWCLYCTAHLNQDYFTIHWTITVMQLIESFPHNLDHSNWIMTAFNS